MSATSIQIGVAGMIDSRGADGIARPARTQADVCTIQGSLFGGSASQAGGGHAVNLIARSAIQNNGQIDTRGGAGTQNTMLSQCGPTTWFDHATSGMGGGGGGGVFLSAPTITAGNVQATGGQGGLPGLLTPWAVLSPDGNFILADPACVSSGGNSGLAEAFGGARVQTNCAPALTPGSSGLNGSVAQYIRTHPELLLY
jgi:hypothetical protein